MLRTCCEWWRLISSAIGMAVGTIMFLLYFCLYGNYAAGVWAIMTGMFAAISFHITYLHLRDGLETWHNVETLRGITLLGVMVSVAGAAGFIWYLFAALYYHIPFLPISDSSFITSIWAALTFKFGLLLICTSRSYINDLYRETPPLLSA